MAKILEQINGIVWGIPALSLILGVGLYLTVRTGFAQFTLFPRAVRQFLRLFRRKEQSGGAVSPFQALCTALGATVGTGNLAGVAGAIAIGGPGAIFWMWVCGWIGMVTKFAEAALAVCYRKKNAAGEYVGGPMYMISQGMPKKWHWLAAVYSFFGVVAAFGVGNATQINAVIAGVNQVITAFGGVETTPKNLGMGLLLAVLLTVLLSGGMKRIGRVAEKIVPFGAAGYLLLGTFVLIVRREAIPGAFGAIISGAFSPRAVTGGVIGSMFAVLRIGVSRGVFTNEAGMGTASIAHAAAQVEHPVEQGLMGLLEVFLDTIVICTMTALVILVSGAQIPYGQDVGVALTVQAFSRVCGDWAAVFLALALCLFAFATVLGWGLYGARCAQYLFGDHVFKRFVAIQAVAVVLGAVLQTGTVWTLSEIVNGLMAIPNLIVLAVLSPKLIRLTKSYKRKTTGFCVVGGTYEDIYQRQPLRAVSHAEIPPVSGAGKKGRKADISSEYRSAGPGDA